MYCSKIKLSFLLALLGGCAAPHSDVMVFGTQTTVGVDISAAPEQASSPNFVIGYKRKELVWMPLFVNGIDSNLLKYKRQGFYTSGLVSSVEIPEGTSDINLAEGKITPLPAGTKINLDSTTEIVFMNGSSIATPLNVGNIVLKANKKVSIPVNSIIQDTIGVSYKGIDLHNAKYMAASRDNETQKSDTYSVLASFGSDISANSSGAGVGVAQYFATGIAAQNLTLTGGADLVTIRSVDAQMNSKLEQEVVELKKTNLQLLEDSLGEKKALEIRKLVGDKIKVQDAKIILLEAFFSTTDGMLDKNLLATKIDSIDSAKLPVALKNRIKSRTTLDSFVKNLRSSDFLAIDPIYESIH